MMLSVQPQCNCTIANPGPSVATCGGSTFILFMGLLEQFLRSQCDIEDNCGHMDPRINPDPMYDFIVVGSGSAGSVVASRLSEVAQWRVLLVEAGGNEPTGSQVPSLLSNFFGTAIDWRYYTEPEERACLGAEGRRCYWPRGKVIGGTSVMNGMMYMRGSRTDYNQWARLGNTGWSYDEVLPYFIKSENNMQVEDMDRGYHGVGGYLPVSRFPYHPPLADAILRGAQELGQRVGDLNGQYHEGFDIMQTNNRNGIRYSMARAFLRPIKNRPNFHVMLNTTALRVVMDAAEKQAIGVEVLRPDGRKEIILAKKEVVLSAGALNSPQLLLLSGIGHKDDLAKVGVPTVHHLPGVGRNLHNHVAVRINYYLNETSVRDLNWAVATHYLLNRDGLMSGTGMSQTTGMIKTRFANMSDDHPDAQIFFGGYSANCAQTGQVGEMNGELVNGVPPRRLVTITPTVLHPKSRGYLTLRDNNPLSMPSMYPRYLTHPDDIQVLIEGVKFVQRLANTAALRSFGMELDPTPARGCESQPFGSDSYWECVIRTHTVPEHHQAGTCKMGPASDPEAVVDPELKVHGVKGLRVMDAAIMPILTSGNTNAPCVMIGEKGSDMVKNTWLNQNRL